MDWEAKLAERRRMTTADLVEAVLQRCCHGGLSDVSLRFVLEQVALAVAELPHAPLLEIGTCRGGTAKAILELLRELRGPFAPLLFTVDPYGSKPYQGGDGTVPGGEKSLYTDLTYIEGKCHLVYFGNHAHFLATGEWFLDMLSQPIGKAYKYWREGVAHVVRGFSFAFVDGEHDLATVQRELSYLMGALPARRVVVDNVDKDPGLSDWLRSLGARFEVEGREVGAHQALLVLDDVTAAPILPGSV